MADRKAMTPAEIARRMQVPEENPNYENAPYKALLAPLAVYGGAAGPELAGALGLGSKIPAAGAALGEAASQTPSAVAKAMEVMSASPKTQLVRVGNMNRNLAASAPRIVRTADGQILKLASGEAVPEGATVLNMVEAPVGKMIGYTAAGTALPAALGAEIAAYNTPKQDAGATTPATLSNGTPTSAPQAATMINAGRGDRVHENLNDRALYYALNPQQGSSMLGAWNAPNADNFSTDRAAQAPVVQAAQKAAQKASPAPAADQSSGIANLLSSLFQNKGGEYQSNGDRLYRGDTMDKGMQGPTKPTGVNWGDPDRASDFFRASKAYQGLQDQAPAEKRGGRVSKSGEHSAILHKALEIIHHMALKNH